MTVLERARVKEQTQFGTPYDFATLRHLTIHATSFEIGRTLGRIAIERYGRTQAHLRPTPTTPARGGRTWSATTRSTWSK